MLKAGATTRMQLSTKVGGDEVRGDLFFNREFRDGSWTRPNAPRRQLGTSRPRTRELWLHFNTDTRVDWQQPFNRASSMTRSQRNATERVSGLTC